jgi:cytoskeletal protein CcmA (bactofilin family)
MTGGSGSDPLSGSAAEAPPASSPAAPSPAAASGPAPGRSPPAKVPSGPLPSAAALPRAETRPPPLVGEIRDRGASRRDRVRAQFWSANGASKVLGDVEVETGETDGFVSIRGTLVADSFRARGRLDVGGDLRVRGPMSIEGTGRFGAGAELGRFHGDGTVETAGRLRATESAETAGFLGAQSVEAPKLRIRGRVRIPGEIRAETVEAHLEGGESRIGVLRAQVVKVAKGGRVPWKRGSLVAERIEAVEAELEGVRAGYVRADRVSVGAGCHLSRVDGRIVYRHRSAHIGPESESSAPPWLTR